MGGGPPPWVVVLATASSACRPLRSCEFRFLSKDVLTCALDLHAPICWLAADLPASGDGEVRDALLGAIKSASTTRTRLAVRESHFDIPGLPARIILDGWGGRCREHRAL